jgi:hypothetical protein
VCGGIGLLCAESFVDDHILDHILKAPAKRRLHGTARHGMRLVRAAAAYSAAARHVRADGWQGEWDGMTRIA